MYHSERINCNAGRLILVTDVHYCQEAYHNLPAADRMSVLCRSLEREFGLKPYDGILSLGDYSMDHWRMDGSYLWDPPVSNTEIFAKTYVPQMPADFYMIPGNHEQYGDAKWQEICGRPREYVLLYGAYVIVMLDTFAGELDPTENSDGCYTGINTRLLSRVLEDYPDKKIILCAHDIDPKQESEEARQLICNEKRILCAFAGHMHRDNAVLLPDGWRNLPVFYCGNFSWYWGYQKQKNWGYRILELSEDRFSTEYVRVSDE